MNYLIANGRVVASQSQDMETIVPYLYWITSSDETIEVGKTTYNNGVFTKDSDNPQMQAINLALKLSTPLLPADVLLKTNLMTALGVK